MGCSMRRRRSGRGTVGAPGLASGALRFAATDSSDDKPIRCFDAIDKSPGRSTTEGAEAHGKRDCVARMPHDRD